MSQQRHLSRSVFSRFAGLLTFLFFSLTLLAQSQGRLHYRVSLDSALGTAPVSGRLIVFMTSDPKPQEILHPSIASGSNPMWMAAREVQDLAPGKPVDLDPDEIAYPQPLSQAPSGDYQIMALLDTDHTAAYNLFGAFSPDDLRSAVVEVKGLNPKQSAPVELKLTEHVSKAPSQQPGNNSQSIDFVSASLSKFWGREIHMRGYVALPPDYASSDQRYPTVYWTHGFGAHLENLSGVGARLEKEMADGSLPPMIWVVLDETCSGGTHEFADSVNNGPWGEALTTELIPYLERAYRMDAKPSGRFLTGHSSGGWATMWLEVTYPKVFGGNWSTSPDPVDFRDFTNIDLTKDQNAYTRPDGKPTPLVRMGNKDVANFEQVSREEVVMGDYGGQIASFEWVFSPRGTDGRPMPMFDRQTGAIHRDVVDYWLAHYDISLILTQNAKQLVPQLRGKIHIIVGTADTFYLDGAVHLLEQAITPLGYKAKITYLEGRTHMDLYKGGLEERIAEQMYNTARPGNHWKPKIVPDPATQIAQ
jgi:enterochelin esterase-like enzyme